MSMKQNHTLYSREIICVQPYPLKVRAHVLGNEPVWTMPWMASSVVSAIRQTSPTGEVRVAIREDGPMFDFQPGKLAQEYLGVTDPEMITMVDAEDFDAFTTVYMTGVNNITALQRLIPAIEKYVPAFRFMPRHLQYLIKETDPICGEHELYKHMPRMFMRYNLADYEALVWLDRSSGQISPKRFPKLNIDPEKVLHVGGAWYAFRSLDDAVGVKFMAPATEIHRIREDV